MKALSAVICVIAVSALTAQTPPAFETARVTGYPHDEGCRIQYLPDTFSVTYCSLSHIVGKLYSVRDFQIVDAPEWFHDADGYNIDGKAAGPVDEDQLKLMARQLFADRFHLKVHRETRQMLVYALVVSGNGPRQNAKDNGQPRGSGYTWSDFFNGVERVRGLNVSMSTLAAGLAVDRPVIDKTNFSGAIDFDLRYAGGTSPPSIFSAMPEQLGLVLRPETDPVEVLVIDHVEKLSEN